MKEMRYFRQNIILLLVAVVMPAVAFAQGSGDTKVISSTFTEVTNFDKRESWCYGEIQTQEGRQWHFFGPGNPDWPSFKRTTVSGTGCLEISLRRYWSFGVSMSEKLSGKIKAVHVKAGGNLGQISLWFGEYNKRDYEVHVTSGLSDYTFDVSDEDISMYDEALTVGFTLKVQDYYNPFYLAAVTIEYCDLDRIETSYTNTFYEFEQTEITNDLKVGFLKTREGNRWSNMVGEYGPTVYIESIILGDNPEPEEVVLYQSTDGNFLVIGMNNSESTVKGCLKRIILRASGGLDKIETRVQERNDLSKFQKVTTYPSMGDPLQDIEIPLDPNIEYEDALVEITIIGVGIVFLKSATIVVEEENIPLLRGKCGDDAIFTIWKLPYMIDVWDSSIRDYKKERAMKLVFSGTGEMEDYLDYHPSPWSEDYGEYISEVVVQEGLKNLGNYALRGLGYVTKVTLPSSLKSIGTGAIECRGITAINIPDAVETIGEYAFWNCQNLRTVRLGKGLRNIGKCIFLKDTKIDDVYAYADPNNLTWEAYPVNENEAFKPNKATLFHVVPGTKDIWESKFGFLNVTFVEDLEDVMASITEKKTVSPMDLASKDLKDNVVDDIYYNLDPSTGSGYRDGYLQIGKTTDISTIGSGTPGSIEVRNNFTGIILMVGPGSGIISLNVAGTSGMKLAVSFNGKTTTYALTNRPEEVHISYDLDATKFVYIYAVGSGALVRAFGNSEPEVGDDYVAIYGITIEPEAGNPDGIITVDEHNNRTTDSPIYDLNGRRLIAPQKGFNIIRLNDGTSRKVLIK